jgi:DNA-directed RNA polymerase subunit RPC12/RpoP
MQCLRSNKGGGQATLAVIAGICIVVAGYFIIKQTKTKQESPYASAFYYCTSCEKEFTGDSTLVPPVKCPICKQLTGVRLRKYRCDKCKKVFPAYLEKFDMEDKLLIEKRNRGEAVPPGASIGSELICEFGTDDWINASDQAALDFIASVKCPNCGATSPDIKPIFPESEKK